MRQVLVTSGHDPKLKPHPGCFHFGGVPVNLSSQVTSIGRCMFEKMDMRQHDFAFPLWLAS
jgi:hypothetical protein